MPGVSRAVAPYTLDPHMTSPRNNLTSATGVVVAVNDVATPPSLLQTAPPPVAQTSTGLPFDEEAKLVYGVILSLRNLIRKLSGRYASPFCNEITH